MSQDRIWEAYQNEPGLQAMGCRDGGRIRFIAKRIRPPCHVLNIGVGLGNLERVLLDKGVDVYSLDPSETSIERLKSDLGDRARVGYSQEIPFPDGTFDRVVMTEVLEHLSEDVFEATLGEVARVLKPGGRFIGSVPADENLVDSLVICPHCGERFHRWGHQQSFSEADLRRSLESVFPKVSVDRIFFADFRNLNWKGKLSSLLKMLQARLGRKGSNQNFYFSARR